MSALKICPQCGTEYPANERFCPRDGTALRSQDPQADLVGSIIADRYHVLRKLGEGGMGQVYLAEHVKMGRKSAVKVMRPAMVKDVDAISRFNREAANASRINHPNIAGIYDFGETAEGIIYLAMEFIEGQSLTAIIEQQGALQPLRAATLLMQTADALGAAHDMGIVHRDLKPDNIMITKNRDGTDCVKVVDFGIAKAAGSDAQKVTKTGLVIGTPEYMSPEQLAGDKLDGRSDIYSLGLVAFNMLTGTLPFPSESAQESMIMRLTDKPKMLGEVRPEIPWPADLQAVMDKALSRDVTQRYQTAPSFGREFYQAVERMPATQAAQAGTQVLDAQPVPATRVAVADRTVAMPAPEVPVVTNQSPAAPRKSKTGVYAGVGGVVLLAAIGVYVLNSGKNSSPPGSGDTTTKSTAAIPAKPDTTKTDSSRLPNANPGRAGATSARTTDLAKPTNSAGGGTSAPTKNLEEQLRDLIDDSQDPKRASKVEPQIKRLSAQAKSNDELYLAALLQGYVLVTTGRGSEACSFLTKALPGVLGEKHSDLKERMTLPPLSCPES